MTNSKHTKRALLVSILTILLCVAMLVGSTFAWFTDSVSTGVNRIQAGNLKIDLIDADGNSLEGKTLEWDAFDGRGQEEILWEPGATYNTQEFYIKNAGNLNLKFKFVVSGIEGAAKLLEVIDFTAMAQANQFHFNTGAVSVTPGEGETFDLLKGYTVDTVFYGEQHFDEYVLEPGEIAGPITITGHMQETAGNEYQGLSIDGIAITLLATQATGDEDSFNGTYDEDVDVLVENLKNQLAAGGNVTMATDVTLPLDSKVTDGSLDPMMVVTNDTTLNLAGKTLSLDQEAAEESLPYVPTLIVVEDGTLTLDGDGVISAEAGMNTAYGINVNGGTLVINDGSYYGAMSAVQVQSGTLIINGGFFDLAPTIKSVAPQYVSYLINCIDRAYKDGTAKVEICGGTFVNFDPSNNSAEGAGTNFVAEGYTVTSEVQENGETWYTVVKTAGTVDELEDAIENATDGETVYVGKDLSPNSTLELSNSITLDLGDTVIDGNNNGSTGIRLSGDGNDITIQAATGGVQMDEQRCFQVGAKNSNITFDGGNYSITNDTNAILMEDTFSGGSNNVTIQNITYTGDRGVQFSNSDNNTILIKDSILNTDGYSALFIGGNNNVCTLENVTINGGGSWGSRLFATNSGHSGDDGYSVIYIVSGFYDCWLSTSSGCTISISGGTFTDDPTDYLAQGYKADYDSSTRMWTVTAE